MNKSYVIDTYENNVYRSSKYVGDDYDVACEILMSDRECGGDYRLRIVYTI